MSVTITVKVEGSATAGQSPPTLSLDGPRIVIGRGPGCDVRLPELSVSQRHATIEVDAGSHFLVDEASCNGTFVGGTRLSPRARHLLRPSELVRVGRVWLEVKLEARPQTRDLAQATRDLALGLVSSALRALGEDPSPTLRVVEGRDLGRTLMLEEEGRAYTIGRGEECDFQLADPDASRVHAQVVLRKSAVLVRDIESKNGMSLGDEPVRSGRDTAWKGATLLRLGGTVLALEEPAQLALSEIEASPDEPLGEGEIPPPPMVQTSADDQAPDRAQKSPTATAASPSTRNVANVSKRAARTWSTAELTIVLTAMLVIAISAGGLVWLFRGK